MDHSSGAPIHATRSLDFYCFRWACFRCNFSRRSCQPIHQPRNRSGYCPRSNWGFWSVWHLPHGLWLNGCRTHFCLDRTPSCWPSDLRDFGLEPKHTIHFHACQYGSHFITGNSIFFLWNQTRDIDHPSPIGKWDSTTPN